LGEFIELVARVYGCTLKTLPSPLIGLKGPTTVRYLTCASRPILLLPDMPDSQRLTATTLSSFCRTLNLDPEDFEPDEPPPH
jgi:hypothetical protein